MTKKPDELDTETTFADMNVEGFRWYDPNKKKGKTEEKKVSRKEYRAMIKGALAALLPVIVILTIAAALVYLLVWLWIG